MTQQFDDHNPIYEKREEEVISPKDGKPTKRIARFLKPFAKNTNEVVGIPKTPLLSDIFTYQNLQKWPFKVHTMGWKKPHKDWEKWYDKLVINHATKWIEAGILDGIQASLHEIPCNKDLVLGVVEFWCPETNTFIFPWGEATITLEDVMILGGFPVIGAPVDKNVEGDSLRVVEGLRKARRAIASVREKKGEERVVSFLDWMKHFMEDEELEEGEIEKEDQEGEFEHVAFLSLWLSIFVLPNVDNEELILKEVFPIATHLSQGTPIALGPVVLANLYHELTCLNQKAVDPHWKSSVYVSGLFKIVQLWVCERFPGFGANLAKPLELGDPRVARWDNVNFDVTLSSVRSGLRAGENFQWRPYACDLENWDDLPFYGKTERIISDYSVLDDCMWSFGRFLHSSKLVGTDCEEMYHPHRVAMHFGYDQDIPGEIGLSTSSWDKSGFYVPSRDFEPGLSRDYYDWWKDCMMYREEAIMDALGQGEDKKGGKRPVEGQRSEGDGPCEKGNRPCSTEEGRMLKNPPSGLQKSAKYRVNMEPSSLPLGMEKQANDHILVAPEVSKIAVKMSPALKKSNSRESHVSVRPKSPSAVKKPAPQDENDKDDVSNDLDNVPLALRSYSNSESSKNAPNKEMIQRPALLAPKSSRVKNEASPCSSDPNVVSMSLDSHSLDHVPLALRLKSGAGYKCKPSESYASTVHGGDPQRVKSYAQTEELASPSSDADSQITGKKSCKGKKCFEVGRKRMDNAGGRNPALKEGLEARVTKLERAVSTLTTAKFGRSKFAVRD